MISGKWNFNPPSREELCRRDEIARKFGLSPAVCLLMVRRGISSDEEVRQFISPSWNDMHDPFLYPDMEKAVNRLNLALGNKEKIMIYGDYDVDGTTAVALVYRFLEFYTLSSILDYYIPDRYDEGYGISDKAIRYAQDKGISLVIALDCGIKAVEKIAFAKTLGIDFIICDHHKPDDVLPDAVAILNALRTDSTYPYPYLSGCGVGFKFMHAFAISNNVGFSQLRLMFDYVAVSIAADVVPITGENRVLATFGLYRLNYSPSKGLKGIIEVCGLKGKEITMSDIVFKIGPRINASGRIMNGRESVDLLLARDSTSAREKSESADQYNDDRRELDKKITDQAYAIIDTDPETCNKRIIIIHHPEWHKGIIGIVASRLAEKYYKPVIVFTEANGHLSGSARSVTGFDIYRAIESCKDILVNFGGHPFAAGVTIDGKDFPAFCSRIESYAEEFMSEEQMTQSLDVDIELRFSDINLKLLKDQKRMRPFGSANQKPVYLSRQVRDAGTSKLVGKELEHIKLDLIDDSTTEVISAIAYGMHRHAEYVKSGKTFDICYTLEENNYSKEPNIQLQILDISIPCEQ
ncbi:MAG: single-stranded-DNA-specific exonuclease RecJ [Dysgonamonadaceae bacterium]|jgi:single-stranded-DNA-specific exonuclease|nr:single-stranded-DNA-specific exonuclease RecJ [Dysgonamonadaceae bacterium]